jgi:hypothetical protein
LTIPQFVRKAFNDELKFADLYDASAGVKLSGAMDSRTAQALGEATQDLITKAVSHTQFPSLLER